ncbi:MAG: aminotransferase class I/II-fold pyridoxal phosphate-dependent enzyme [Alphaproteobacteria bacterium]|nr:aminotransferase class I/II-fold pyridoxal phosphate-dependent enzyme [Alphaproteobacteria bacterium]
MSENLAAVGPAPRPPEPPFLTDRVDTYYRDEYKAPIVIGRTPASGSLQFRNNDYLGLARHPLISQAQINAILEQGNGAMMSGVFPWERSDRAVFETRLARFMRCEATLAVQSGYCANLSFLQAIAGPRTPVFLDVRAHMSLWEGVRTGGGTAHYFRHNDADHLERQIKTYGRGVVVVDSVYSTIGSICPLREVAALCDRYGCILLVDEAHSLGTHGPRARPGQAPPRVRQHGRARPRRCRPPAPSLPRCLGPRSCPQHTCRRRGGGGAMRAPSAGGRHASTFLACAQAYVNRSGRASDGCTTVGLLRRPAQRP